MAVAETKYVLGYFLASMINTDDGTIVRQLKADYIRYNYPVVSVQAIVHVNGQPKIKDILLVRKKLHE